MRNTPVINLTTYASLKENLAEILPELKEAFIEDGLILLDQIKDNLNQGDSTVIMTAAHTLKSSASNMGADQLAEYCMKIEEDPLGNAEDIAALHQKAQIEMQAVQTTLAELD